MRTRRFSLDFDTPNTFAVSSAVAKVDSRTMVIFILSSYDTLIYPKKLEVRFIFIIPPSTNLWRLGAAALGLKAGQVARSRSVS